jgi:AbrB family looped-hinge helix DNA binding protein
MTVMVRLSSKGQLVIPGAVRRALQLAPGAQLNVTVVERKIVLDPVPVSSPIDALYGRFAGQDLLDDLEREHRREIADEPAIRP